MSVNPIRPLVAGVALVLSATHLRGVETEVQPADVLRLVELAQTEIYQKALPSVVLIEVELQGDAPLAEAPPTEGGEQPKRLPQGESKTPAPPASGPPRSEGSGFVVRPGGVIATNYHVVARARKITVRFANGKRFTGRLIGNDERSDVALVQIDAKDLPALEFADSDAALVGQFVGAIGAPSGQEWSFSKGVLSGKGRSRLLGPSSNLPLIEDYLQTDTFISPGHSGGPLLDSQGRVLGMNTLVSRLEKGLAFAIPSSFLKRTVSQLLAEGRVVRPWLGIRVETLGQNAALFERLSAAGTGGVVLAIEADGPAFRSDLRPADVIQAIDGVVVKTAQDIQRELFAKKVGQPVRVQVWRQNTVRVLTLTPSDIPEALLQNPDKPLQEQRPVDPAPERLGLVLHEARGLGVRVEAVEPGGLAARAGLQNEDAITEVEGHAVHSAAECLRAIRSGLGRGGPGAILQVERKGRRIFVLLSGAGGS